MTPNSLPEFMNFSFLERQIVVVKPHSLDSFFGQTVRKRQALVDRLGI